MTGHGAAHARSSASRSGADRPQAGRHRPLCAPDEHGDRPRLETLLVDLATRIPALSDALSDRYLATPRCRAIYARREHRRGDAHAVGAGRAMKLSVVHRTTYYYGERSRPPTTRCASRPRDTAAISACSRTSSWSARRPRRAGGASTTSATAPCTSASASRTASSQVLAHSVVEVDRAAPAGARALRRPGRACAIACAATPARRARRLRHGVRVAARQRCAGAGRLRAAPLRAGRPVLEAVRDLMARIHTDFTYDPQRDRHLDAARRGAAAAARRVPGLRAPRDRLPARAGAGRALRQRLPADATAAGQARAGRRRRLARLVRRCSSPSSAGSTSTPPTTSCPSDEHVTLA